jgi:hypothetical protein
MDKTQAKFLKEREAQAIKGQSGLKALRARLLKLGGKFVCFFGFEENLEKIMARGVLMKGGPRGGKPIMARGEASRCHSNSAACWEANQGELFLCTGYALSDDGIWRQHSWCWHHRLRKVVETTEPRVAYFGYRMCPSEADRFLYENS